MIMHCLPRSAQATMLVFSARNNQLPETVRVEDGVLNDSDCSIRILKFLHPPPCLAACVCLGPSRAPPCMVTLVTIILCSTTATCGHLITIRRQPATTSPGPVSRSGVETKPLCPIPGHGNISMASVGGQVSHSGPLPPVWSLSQH